MGLFRKQKAPALTREQALSCIPVKNNVVDWQIIDSGFVQIEYVLLLKPFLLSIFKRFDTSRSTPPTRKLQLDALGSQVWQLIDGRRSTGDLIEEFARIHRISVPEAEQSITAFLRELGRRGLIALR